MEDPRWLRLIIIGLVLAAVAVGYFLFTGKFASDSAKKPQQITQVSSPSPTATQSAVPSPSVLGQNTQGSFVSPTPTPASAYNAIVERTKGGQPIQNLPRTGFPLGLLAALSVPTLIIGWGLRRFPR